MQNEIFYQFLYLWIGIALLLFPIQLWWITAPYGRHSNKKWGWMMDNRWGWIVMELVSPLLFAGFFLSGANEKTSPMWFFFVLWMLHYFNRSIIYPLRTKTQGKQIPILIVLFAVMFNSVNGWSNGYYLGTLGTPYPEVWWYTPQFIVGAILFILGVFINFQSDNILLNLRAPGETGYKIPKGGMFRYISCPNHFGEILEWTGFAIMCWNIAAWGFAIWTAANLIPRAVSHHRWYKTHCETYPNE